MYNISNITSVSYEQRSCSCGCRLCSWGDGGVMCHPSHRRVINVRCFVFPTRRPTPAAASPLPLFNRNVSHSRNKHLTARTAILTPARTLTHSHTYVGTTYTHRTDEFVLVRRRRRSFVRLHSFSRHSIGSARAEFDFLPFV